MRPLHAWTRLCFNDFIYNTSITYEPPHDKTNKMACAPSKDSDQPGHPPSLIRVFAVRMRKAWVPSYPLSAQRRLWSDWADAKADLSSLGAQSFCWFCHIAAHLCSHTTFSGSCVQENTSRFVLLSRSEVIRICMKDMHELPWAAPMEPFFFCDTEIWLYKLKGNIQVITFFFFFNFGCL